MATIALTGSASGIGAATAEVLRKQGDRVIGVDLRDADVTDWLPWRQDNRFEEGDWQVEEGQAGHRAADAEQRHL